MKPLAATALLLLCAVGPPASAAPAPQDAFFDSLRSLCGKTFHGRLASPPTEADAIFAAPVSLQVRDCTATEVRMPLTVGDDRSRTWIVTRTEDGLVLKHDHRHPDGAEDAFSRYGGPAAAPGQANRQDFPADAFSREMFERLGAPASVFNVWSLEVRPGALLAYELNRPGRHVRLEFDLGPAAKVP